MIEQLLPAGVASAEAFTDPPGLVLMPAEQSLISRAVEKRRREFTTVRHCARQALGELGHDPVPILKGDKGAPVWPAGIVGSLTHCDGYRAATVAYAMAVRSLGIDAEPHDSLPDGVLEHTSLPAEREVLATRSGDLHWDRLLFCAKEATYKAWFPVAKRWLGFEDAHITFEQSTPNSGTFTSRILIDPAAADGGAPLLEFGGRWLVDRGIITTTIALT
ncbi:4'-phosphopantetheinyl transferase [Gordonia sp. 'Campus']|uniref:4'-phosphopantetheinyl transferase family protein n=1 Tax=Gordonia sp. 'Campus' TaxID=2915824 RepID=UPI001EE4DF18|nr:4'-phosphopantetheinyl transferase superfamily protein [Gordonia sp. 'Campus']